MLVSHYKIELKEEPQFAHESFEERKTRVLAAKAGISLTYVTGFQYIEVPYSNLLSSVPFESPSSSNVGIN
jgi:hypothetical protein